MFSLSAPSLPAFNQIGLDCHREAALAAVAIQSSFETVALDCFAALAMTPLKCCSMTGFSAH